MMDLGTREVSAPLVLVAFVLALCVWERAFCCWIWIPSGSSFH